MAKRKPIATFEVEGFEDLRNTLLEVAPTRARSILRQTVHGLAGEVRDALKRNVKKDTGQLAKSIKAYRMRGEGPDKHVSEVRGGSSAPYMLMLEFGTSKTKAQPFIGPTTENFRPRLPEIYRKEFAEKFAKSLARGKTHTVVRVSDSAVVGEHSSPALAQKRIDRLLSMSKGKLTSASFRIESSPKK